MLAAMTAYQHRAAQRVRGPALLAGAHLRCVALAVGAGTNHVPRDGPAIA